MNNAMKTAIEAVKNNNTDETKNALRELAVPKFKQVYGRVQDAVRTVNRHLGPDKGTPNRAKIALAIGLADEVRSYKEVADLIGMAKMNTACDTLNAIISKIYDMRKNLAYDHIDFLPDFTTDEDDRVIAVEKAKRYLANIIGGVNTAIGTIAEHICAGDFDVNTFKIAKALGYKDEIATLRADFNALVTANEPFTDELALVTAVETAIDDIIKSKGLGFRLGVKRIDDYDPYAVTTTEDDGGEDKDE